MLNIVILILANMANNVVVVGAARKHIVAWSEYVSEFVQRLFVHTFCFRARKIWCRHLLNGGKSLTRCKVHGHVKVDANPPFGVARRSGRVLDT